MSKFANNLLIKKKSINLKKNKTFYRKGFFIQKEGFIDKIMSEKNKLKLLNFKNNSSWKIQSKKSTLSIQRKLI